MVSEYKWIPPRSERSGVFGHMVIDGIYYYLFHYGEPIVALGPRIEAEGWHCYVCCDGFDEHGKRQDWAATLTNVNNVFYETIRGNP